MITGKFDTLAIHGGYEPKDFNGCICPPVCQTNAYDFGSTERAAALFGLEEDGHIYSRISNPTVEVLEKRIAMLDGGNAAVAFSSGHNAIYSAVCCLCGTGDEIVASAQIYGGAINMLSSTLGQFGIKTTFVDCDDLAAWEAAVTPKTKLFFFETVGNPNANVADISAICEIAHRHGIITMADSTFTTPYLCRPLEFGADLVVHSATKFLCGHGNAMGGLLVDGGSFVYEGNPRYTDFYTPDDSYHGVVFTKSFADAPFAGRLRCRYLRDIGGCMSPNSAYLTLLGIETLSVRMRRHCENAEKIAAYLQNNPKVMKVNYPSLETSEYYAAAQKYLKNGCGSIFTCELDGDRKRCGEFMDRLNIFANVANVGDLRSMVIHPASTTHSQLSDSQLRAGGIGQGTVRISVGLEDPDDLIADLDSALSAL